eukprot:339080_1
MDDQKLSASTYTHVLWQCQQCVLQNYYYNNCDNIIIPNTKCQACFAKIPYNCGQLLQNGTILIPLKDTILEHKLNQSTKYSIAKNINQNILSFSLMVRDSDPQIQSLLDLFGLQVSYQRSTFYVSDFCNGRDHRYRLQSKPSVNNHFKLDIGTWGSMLWIVTMWDEKRMFLKHLIQRDESWCDDSNVDRYFWYELENIHFKSTKYLIELVGKKIANIISWMALT